MSGFYFGSSDRPLYGFYHQPRSRPVRRDGVVLCNPMGGEYLRTHRTLRQLATRLSSIGFHVLRFDYYGTGDSSGEGEEATIEQWKRDVSTAADELQAISAVRRVSLVGVRVGAAVAAMAATARIDLEDLVFWDPVVHGDAHLESLLEGEAEMRRRFNDNTNGRGSSPAEVLSPAIRGTIGVAGFPLSHKLRSELAGIDLTALDRLPVRRALVVVSQDEAEHDELRDRLDTLVPSVRKIHRPGSDGFDNPGRMGNVVLLPAIVSSIVSFFEEREG